MLEARKHIEGGSDHGFVNPIVELNAGLWSLYAGATLFLFLRIYIKLTRRHGLWYDDHILLISWFILTANNTIISIQYATGYVTPEWDDRMQILINISSCGTLIGQALTKTAFAVTLLKLVNNWQRWVLWFCIVTMNAYMVAKLFMQWAKISDKPSYEVWYRLDFHVTWKFREDFKEGGNVYNIIMDFIFALFPWLITWKLDMRRVEKYGLCFAMSLGMIVAIVSAIRVGWKDKGNPKDEWYFWRNAHSNIWFSSEIVGTIIVQCIPILRPLLRDFHTSLTSKRLGSTTDPGTQRRSKYLSWMGGNPNETEFKTNCWAPNDIEGCPKGSIKRTDKFEMNEISEVDESSAPSSMNHDLRPKHSIELEWPLKEAPYSYRHSP